MHYPPETASVMLIAQMIATVLQVSIFMGTITHMYLKCLFGFQLYRYQCMMTFVRHQKGGTYVCGIDHVLTEWQISLRIC